MLIFYFLEKGLGIVFPPYLVYDLSRKMFAMLCYINRTNFVPSFPLLLEILNNICIAILSFQGCDVIIFEIKFLKFFIICKGLSDAKNYFRP